MNTRDLKERLDGLAGRKGVFVRNLVSGEEWTWQPDCEVTAASVIKLPIMVEFFRQAECGMLDETETYRLREADKMEGSGVLFSLREGCTFSLHDLMVLMVIVSDNTATNILIDKLGMENVNRTLAGLGLSRTRLRRKLFDEATSRAGIQNTITAGDMGRLLTLLYEGKAVSEAASWRMLKILADQQFNGKIPFFLDLCVSHKTGEDEGISHDVGIVWREEPLVLCFVGEQVDVPAFERWMQDAAGQLCE